MEVDEKEMKMSRCSKTGNIIKCSPLMCSGFNVGCMRTCACVHVCAHVWCLCVRAYMCVSLASHLLTFDPSSSPTAATTLAFRAGWSLGHTCRNISLMMGHTLWSNSLPSTKCINGPI